MLISSEKVGYCLDRANAIIEAYEITHLAADDPRRYVDNLLHTCSTYLTMPIQVRKLDISKEKTKIWGACVNEGNRYVIAYVKGLNDCWTRFVVCKEIFHAILDHPDYWNMDLYAHIAEVTLTFPVMNSQPGPAVVAEILAEIAAMQFLFPYARRLQELAGPDSGNSLAIAEKYKIPQVRVEQYLSPGLMDALKSHHTA